MQCVLKTELIRSPLEFLGLSCSFLLSHAASRLSKKQNCILLTVCCYYMFGIFALKKLQFESSHNLRAEMHHVTVEKKNASIVSADRHGTQG